MSSETAKIQPPNNVRDFSALLDIVKALRGPDGCPWDKEQTHRTLTPFAIEESHELAEAIEKGDRGEMVSELGDLLLQVVLHAEIGRQEGTFAIEDVLQAINEKMIRRHPHVFANESAATSGEVLDNWSKIKAAEKKAAGKTGEAKSFEIPVSMPALTRSQKIGDKTKRLRFDWNNAKEVLGKVDEELAEVKVEVEKNDTIALEHEIGDLLFSVAQLARHSGLEAEQCLRVANARFETRFFKMREMIAASGRDYDKLSPPELEEAWQAVKKSLKS